MDTGPIEGEFFADEAQKPIPPKHTWDDLSTVELIDVKAQLEDKLWAFANNPLIAKTLQQGVNQVTALISSRTS